MDLPEVMVLLNSSLEEGDPHCFWNLVSVRKKTVQQMKFLLEMAEKLVCSTFPTVSETEVGDVGSQSNNLMLCNT